MEKGCQLMLTYFLVHPIANRYPKYKNHLAGVEVGTLDIVLPPPDPRLVLHELVVLLEDLAEPGEVEILIVLQEDEAQVELGEGQLQVHHFAPALLEFLLATASHAGVALHLVLERGKLARGLGQLLRVEGVDLGELLAAESEKGLVKPGGESKAQNLLIFPNH